MPFYPRSVSGCSGIFFAGGLSSVRFRAHKITFRLFGYKNSETFIKRCRYNPKYRLFCHFLSYTFCAIFNL